VLADRRIDLQQRLGNAQLSSLPSPADLSEYERASDEIVTLLTELPGLIAVYRTGSVSAPGISDLDYIAVVDGRFDLPRIWDRLGPRARYLAMHSPFVADLGAFVRHRWFAAAEPLDRVWGEALVVEERPCQPLSNLVLAAEGLIQGFLRLMKAAVMGRVKVRPTLCMLHAIKYDLQLADLDHEAHLSLWRFVQDVSDVRAQWFELEPDSFETLLKRGLDEFGCAIGALVDRTGDLVSVETTIREMKLGAPWRNVQLKAVAHLDTLSAHAPGWSSWPVKHLPSRRAAELAWRLGTWQVKVPPGLFSLLTGNVEPEFQQFVDERRIMVGKYRDFVASRAAGYSMLGNAATFLGS
jgi:hypothetical protein